ncbi:MAG: radical SAM protein [Proteobacteria bacterium]|nr:radical SAM protein [Pseudomonadota bacterium]NIS68971.1 radical SAM protein [Pseudomonadota bacterium]
MTEPDFLGDLEKCELCEHRCGVNRLSGETGVCRVTMPTVASATLHPAPPESYTVFMAGCNYKCLNCQNWTISQYPDNGFRQRGYENPKELAEECLDSLNSLSAKLMGADRIFFSGGEPTIHLPYIEEVVGEARKINPGTKVNFDTNGYLTDESLKRVLVLTTSITYDLKAYNDEVHLALTGASSKPVLRNAEYIGRYAKEKLWEIRILVIPGINEDEIKPLTEFVAHIDPFLPVCFLVFRPNFVLENHPGASRSLMDKCVETARHSGLKNAYWSGNTDIPGIIGDRKSEIKGKYVSEHARLAGSYALYAGCQTHPRSCSACISNQTCRIKKYIPEIVA